MGESVEAEVGVAIDRGAVEMETAVKTNNLYSPHLERTV